MHMIKLSDEQYQQFIDQGIISPDVPKKRHPVKRVTLDSRFNDGELVSIYHTLEKLERSSLWRARAFLVRFSLGTGLRESEMTRLRFAMDPSLDDKAECRRNGVITVRNAKGSKDRDAACIPELLPHYQDFIQWRLTTRVRESEGMAYLFGKQFNRVTLWRWWREVLDQCPDNVRRLRLHDARHTYGSWEILRVSEPVLNGLMGHAKPDVFRQHYHGVCADFVYGGTPQWYQAAMGRFRK